MMRSYTILGLLLVAALLIGSLGCASQSPAPAAPSAPAGQTSAPKAAPDKVFKLKYSGAFAKTTEFEQVTTALWIRPLEKLSGGRLQFDVYAEGELVSAKNLHDAVTSGAVDVSNNCYLWNSGTIPEVSVTWLPLLYEDPAQEAAVWWDVQRPFFDELYQKNWNQKVLNIIGQCENNIWTSKPVLKLEDMKGLKIRAAGGVQSKFIEALGAGAVSMTPPEAIPALQTGALDGITFNASTIIDMDLFKAVPNVVRPHGFYAHLNMFWNLDSWKKLPADLQDIIVEHSRKVNYLEGAVTVPARMKKQWQTVEGRGQKINTLPAAEQARWQQKAKEAWDWYATQSPGSKKLLDMTLEYLGKK